MWDIAVKEKLNIQIMVLGSLFFYGLLVLGCDSKDELRLDNPRTMQKNTPKLLKSLVVLAKDGYYFGHKRFKGLGFIRCSKRVDQLDYYQTAYSCHGEIKSAKINQKRRYKAQKTVNDAVLGAVQRIITVVLTKQFGHKLAHEFADIQIEAWLYQNPSAAKSAFEEMTRIKTLGFGSRCARFLVKDNTVYFFDVKQVGTKCPVLNEVFRKVSIELGK